MEDLRVHCDENWGSQKSLAAYLDTTPYQVNKWVRGSSLPTTDSVLGILNWLELQTPASTLRTETSMTVLQSLIAFAPQYIRKAAFRLAFPNEEEAVTLLAKLLAREVGSKSENGEVKK